jgi:mono/diheme cytochrome c family protein
MHRLITVGFAARIAALSGLVALACSSFSGLLNAADGSTERGHYLVTIGGCNDCHTPGYFLGKPDEGRFLGGSDVGFNIPNLGSFVGPNLTPDKETGLGNWSTDEIVTAIQTGVIPGGRILAPVMPWHAFAHLTTSDAYAIARYLQGLPPVKHQVPGPFGPAENPNVLLMKVVPPNPN